MEDCGCWVFDQRPPFVDWSPMLAFAFFVAHVATWADSDPLLAHDLLFQVIRRGGRVFLIEPSIWRICMYSIDFYCLFCSFHVGCRYLKIWTQLTQLTLLTQLTQPTLLTLSQDGVHRWRQSLLASEQLDYAPRRPWGLRATSRPLRAISVPCRAAAIPWNLTVGHGVRGYSMIFYSIDVLSTDSMNIRLQRI